MSCVLKFTTENYKKINFILKSRYVLRKDIDKMNCYCPDINLDWLPSIFSRPPSFSELFNLFKQEFNSIELYHSCCPIKLTPYFKHGIQLLNTTRVEKELRDLNKYCMFPSNELEIQNALTYAKNIIQDDEDYRKKIYFHTDKKIAINQPGFSEFGGEYMTYILQELKNPNISNFRDISGIPTLIIVRLPMSFIENEFLKIYIQYFLNRWVSQFIFHENNVSLEVQLSFNSSSEIKPEYIYRHEHPQNFIENRSFFCDICKNKIPRKPKRK